MKWLIRGVLVLLAIVVLVVLIAILAIDSLAKTGITKATTYATGCKTTLGKAHIGIMSGQASLTTLDIANPEGFQSPYFLSLGQGDVEVTLGSLMSDKVEVPLISLAALHMTLESRDGENNYDVILENLKKISSGKDEKEEEPQKQEPAKEGKQFAIHEIVITDIKVDAEIHTLGGESKKIPIEIPKIQLSYDSEQGAQLEDVMGIIIAAVFKAVVANAGDLLPSVMIGGLQDGLSGIGNLGDVSVETIGQVTGQLGEVGEAAGKIGEEAGKVSEDAGKAVEDVGEELGKGIGGLLGGNKEEENGEAKE